MTSLPLCVVVSDRRGLGRRALLCSIGGATVTAGCLDRDEPSTPSFVEDRPYLARRDAAVEVDVETYLGDAGERRSDGRLALAFTTGDARVETVRRVVLLTDAVYPERGSPARPRVTAGDTPQAFALSPVPGEERVVTVCNETFLPEDPQAAVLFDDDAVDVSVTGVGDGLYVTAPSVTLPAFYTASEAYLVGALTTTEAAVYRPADDGSVVAIARPQ